MNKRYRFLSVITLLLNIYSLSLNAQTFKVVIDAGHGGKDPGCIGVTGIKEKDVNLAIALKLGLLIESAHKDVKVIYTRKTDQFLTVAQRPEIANKNKADLFISIHANAVDKKNAANAYGTETFTLGTTTTADNLEVAKRENSVILLEDDYQTRYQGFDPNSAESYIMFETLQGTHQSQSIQLASLVQDEFRTRAKRFDRQVRQAGFLVLRTASMPAILTEVGFLSNRNDERFLASTDGRNKIANSIYHGFRNYKEAYDRHNGITAVRTNENQPKQETEAEKAPAQKKPAAISVAQTSKSKPSVQTAKPAPKQSANTVVDKTPASGQTFYRVQFLSYHKKLPKGSPQLKGLWPVDCYQDNGTYKYTYGNTTNYNEIINSQALVRKKFKDAFVIRFRNGKRVTK